jgi:hypothetical protein
VIPPSKLIPSATVSWIRTLLILRLVNGPVIQMPAWTCWIHTLLIVESCRLPPMPMKSSESTRAFTWPKMAKLDRWTLVLGLGAKLPKTPTPLPPSTEYHSPAPVSVTLLTIRCEVTRKLPGGM